MKTQNNMTHIVISLLVIIAVLSFGKLNKPTFAQSIPVPDDATVEKNPQMVLQNNFAPTIPNDDLSITGISNGFFEAGSTGWVEYSSNGWNLIVNNGFPSGVTPHSGSWMVWLGGDDNEIGYIQQQITVPVGSSFLSNWHWIASADDCGYDIAKINVNNTTVEEYDLCSTASTGGWVEHTVDLSSYAGQSVAFQIGVETDGSTNSNLFIDDVSLSLSYIYLPLLINQ